VRLYTTLFTTCNPVFSLPATPGVMGSLCKKPA
jgi:hypothetical protein